LIGWIIMQTGENVRKVRVCSNFFIRWAFKQKMSDIFNLGMLGIKSRVVAQDRVPAAWFDYAGTDGTPLCAVWAVLLRVCDSSGEQQARSSRMPCSVARGEPCSYPQCWNSVTFGRRCPTGDSSRLLDGVCFA
jgi:hypothetical protein